MHIKHCFHSEDDLAQKLGRSFMRMWRRLLEKYSKRIASLGVNALRLASLSFAFFSAAEEGNAEAMSHFDDMLHGWSAEKLWIGDTMVCFTDEEYVNFVWDGAALMLEADPDLPQKAQWAFDLAGSHVCYAYDVCQEEEVVLPSKYNEVKEVDTQRTDSSSINVEQREVFCPLGYLLDMLEMAPSFTSEYVRDMQLKLYRDYGRICSESDFERIGMLSEKATNDVPTSIPLPVPPKSQPMLEYKGEANDELAAIEKMIVYAEGLPASQQDLASKLKESIGDIYDLRKASDDLYERWRKLGKKDMAPVMSFNGPVNTAIGYTGLFQYTGKENDKKS